MKNVLLIISVIFCSCTSTQQTTSQSGISEDFQEKLNECPENGECTFELFPNKTIEFKKDNIGILYPVLSEGDKTILKYTYHKSSPKNTQDGFYTEIIYAELDNSSDEIELKNEDLQNIKLHFGRFCYCKGQTGYYPISKGLFKTLKNDKNTINFSIDFEIKEVPQIIKNIDATISFKMK